MKVRRIRKSTRLILTVICIVLFATLAVVVMTVSYVTGKAKQYTAVISDKEKQLNSLKKTVYVAEHDIQPGSIISKEDFVQNDIYTSEQNDVFFISDPENRVSKILIPKGGFLRKQDVFSEDITPNEGYLWIEDIHIGSDVYDNCFGDLRIRYPNGEDYVVLAAKRVFERDGSHIRFSVCEQENLIVASACSDIAIYRGSYLYFERCSSDSAVYAKKITYIPNKQVIDICLSSPNIKNDLPVCFDKDQRIALEKRLEAI